MTVTFTKIRGAAAIYRWPATPGLVALSMQWSTGLPHDLGHWMMEAQVDLPWGFWSLAGQQAPYASFELIEGRWPKGKQEWYARVVRKHGMSMLHAEAQDGYWLTDPNLNVRADWPEIRERLRNTYAFDDSPLRGMSPDDVEKLRPFALRNAAIWSELPAGGAVEVDWPGANDLRSVRTEERGVLSLTGKHRVLAVAYNRRAGVERILA